MLQPKEYEPGLIEIPGLNDYIISSDLKRIIRISDGFEPTISLTKGYLCFKISKTLNGKHISRTVFLHNVICRIFHEIPAIPIGERLTVNHKDGEKINNDPFNLEWCTQRYNAQQAWMTGLNDKQYKPIQVKNEDSGEIVLYKSRQACVDALKITASTLIYRLEQGQRRIWPGNFRIRTINGPEFESLTEDEITVETGRYDKEMYLPKPIVIRILPSDEIVEYPTTLIASEYLGASDSSLLERASNSEQLVYMGPIGFYQIQRKSALKEWRKVTDVYEEFDKSRQFIPVYMLDENWNYICQFKTVSECSRSINVWNTTLNRWLKKKGNFIHSGKRYIFKLDYLRLSGKPDWILT